MFDIIGEENGRGGAGLGTKGKKPGKGETPEEEKRRKLLEEALGFVLPKASAPKTCAKLLEVFGSFDGIFGAPEEVLRKVPGVGPETARFLRLMVEISQSYLEERNWDLQRIYDTSSAVELFRPKFLGQKAEVAALMLLDGRNRAVYNDIICKGSVDQVSLHLRQVLQLCIEYDVYTVVLAHNHPSGIAFPSHGDMYVTDRLMAALESIGADLADHIIFADENYFSFRESGVRGDQLKLLRTSQVREMEEVQKIGDKLLGKRKTAK